ncbi:MAG: sigma 54-interacting transcriptional regulator, partial [Desulfobulbaceae bacterium]|nr:sigma 54-interacting transcriptional regulator [Desulfobulbaceae bacterium]
MPVHDFQQAYLFQGLSGEELERIASVAGELILESGDYVYRKGESGTTLYLIAEGKVELIIEKYDGTAYVAGHVSAGGHFGEVSLFTGKPRSLTVRTLAKTRFLTFDKEQFRTILLANPLIHQTLDKILAERLSLASVSRPEPDRSSSASFISAASPAAYASKSSGMESGQPDARKEEKYDFQVEFELAKKIRKKIRFFAESKGPVLINGESGTGRRLAAKQIHLLSRRKLNPYVELDIRQIDLWALDEKIFGHKQDSFPYAAGEQLGILDQINNGTLVLFHAEDLDRKIQQKLCEAFSRDVFSTLDNNTLQSLGARLIVITNRDLNTLKKESIFIPEFAGMFTGSQFALPPLRQHKQDIKPLIDYYLKLYSAEFGKKVTKISPDALNLLMKYDWPGNLTELSGVIHRAVMVSPSEEIISEQIFLGLSGTEQKLSYNLLRLPKVRNIFTGNLLPRLGKSMAALFGVIIFALFLGPQDAEKNLGITLCWYIGWPLLIISFFFLPRFWCSICA